MQNSRLFEILYILLGRERVTAKRLAERFEVSVRTIYRDIDALSAAGVPVYAAQGAGGGISLDDSYVINKSTLSDSEQEEILFALKSLSVADDTNTRELLARLGGLFGKQSSDWIEVDFSPWGQHQKERGILAMLKRSILQKRSITFWYYGSSGLRTHRTAYPVKLVYKTFAWYLQAFDPQKEAYRTFKLFRMEDLHDTGASFSKETLPPVPSLHEFWGEMPTGVRVKLWFDSQVVWRVRDSFDVQDFSYHSDGSMTATVLLPDDDQSIHTILSFGLSVRVIEPSSFVLRLVDQIKNIQNIYTQT